jgi:DNA polymerase-3 subunit beta
LQLTSGKFEITLKGLDADQYPRIQEIASDTPLKINVGVLKTIFAETAFAASQQESRPILTGVHLALTDNKNLKAVATDSHRLSQRKMILDHAAENFNLVIPNKSIAAFRSVFTNDEAELEVFMNENQLLFRTETISFYTRLIEGTYPETDRLIPAESDYTLTVDFKNNDLKRTMDRAKLLTSSTQNGTVKLQFTEDEKVMITVNSAEVGNSVEELDAVAIAGAPLSISFNTLFMIDALKVIDAETVRVRFISSVRPFTLEPLDQTSELIQLITPVRTN